MELQYILQQLRDIGFTEDEIIGFLTIIYNAIEESKDVESQIAYSGNYRYIWAYSLLDWIDWNHFIKYDSSVLNMLMGGTVDPEIGLTWENVAQIPGITQVKCLATSAINTALLGTQAGGKIYRSINYGSNWADCGQLGSYTTVSKILSLGDGVWLAGIGGTNAAIYRSSDDGITWEYIQTLGIGTAVASLIKLDNGYILAGITAPAPTELYRSTDNGLTFDLIRNFTSVATTSCLIDLTGGNVLLFNSADNSWRSTDYGSTWTQIASIPGLGNVLSGAYKDGVVLIGKSIGSIYRSVDSGTNYNLVYTPTEFSITNDIHFVSNIVLACGQNNGVIVRSEDLGLTWESLGRQFSQVYINTLTSFSNNVCLAGTGSNAYVLRSVPLNIDISEQAPVINEPQTETTFAVILGDKTSGWDPTKSLRINTISAAFGQDIILAVGDYEQEESIIDCDGTCQGLEDYKNIALYSATGNHDYERKKWADWFVNDNYGKVSYGNIDFFVLDQYLSIIDNETIVQVPNWTIDEFKASTQGQWLISELAASTAKWKIVLCHSMHYTFMWWNWKDYGVNLIMWGDRHYYSHQIHTYAQGTVHSVLCGVAGCAGLTIGAPVTGYTAIKDIANTNPLCNYGNIIKVWSGTNYLHVKMYGVNAESVTEMDHFEITDFTP